MKNIDFINLKNGDQLFQRNNFNCKDINTYMSPIVFFGINFWPYLQGKEITPANHVGTLYFENGEWWVYEAKLIFTKTKLTDKISNKDIVGLYIKRYAFSYSFDTINMHSFAVELLGTGYDFISILKQFFRKLFNNKIDLETNPRKFKNKKVNCSEANAEQLERARIQFVNTKSISPAELWNDKRSYLVGRLK